MLLGQHADGARDEGLLGLDRPAMNDGDGFQHPLQIIALGGVELVPQKRREVIEGRIAVGGGCNPGVSHDSRTPRILARSQA